MKYDHTNDYNRVAAAIYWLFLEDNKSHFTGHHLAISLGQKFISNKEQYCLHRMCDKGLLARERLTDEMDGEEYTLYTVDPEIVDYVNQYVDDDTLKAIFQRHVRGGRSVDSAIEDNDTAWEPLQLDDINKKNEAIESVEAALSAIEGDNGYAASHPEERNTIAVSIRAGLDLITNFKPAREQVRALLIKPLMRVATVFGAHAVAELAKKAVEKLFSLF